MQVSLPFFPLFTFHLYGLIIGVAAVVGIWLAAIKAKKYGLSESLFEKLWLVGVVSGLIGSRLWHVATDFEYYADAVITMFYIWNGGLSIIGGVVGAVVGLYVYTKYFANKVKNIFTLFLDLAVFGLPVAQAIGRIGNYINYELYGLPTTLPWKIYIPLEFRVSEFINQEYFHPLFLYEIIFTLAFATAIWVVDQRNNKTNLLQIGSGWISSIYILYYCVVRFLLDFLRIDKSVVFAGLGSNQVVLLVFMIGLSIVVWKKKRKYEAS